MGVLSGLQSAGQQLRSKARGGSPAPQDDQPPEGSDPGETSILDENEGSIITSLISQLRIGMDLSKVTFPTFVLEPRSMLERITDFLSHPEFIFGAEAVESDEDRFLRVLQFYLSGWHIKPKGVKKPYNPVLGEFFRCKYDYPNNTQGFYIAEQVSHHPPMSAFLYISPENKVKVCGELRPKSRFLGNSVCTIMEGENRVYLLGRPHDGEYIISMPNMYARGILWGKMVLEIADSCTARNTKSNISADVDFKAKGFFSGTYNCVQGRVKKDGVEIGDISGRWSHSMEYKQSQTGDKISLFDVADQGSNVTPKHVIPEEEQEPNESRRLWQNLTKAILEKNMDLATEAKASVEESQREMRRMREERGQKHVPRFFVLVDGRWVPKISIPDDPKEAILEVQKWIWPSS